MKNTLTKISFTGFFCLVLLFSVSCGDKKSDIAVPAVGEIAKGDSVAGSRRDSLKFVGKPNKIVYWNRKREFNDVNDVHLEAAREVGITPLEKRSDIPNASKPLHLICGKMGFGGVEPYVVEELTVSSPVLVKEAADLLTDIGVNFQDSLRNKHRSPYSLVVTSVLRTKEDVKKLSRNNVNAVENSAHCYGTTVDISCKNFIKHNQDDPDAREVDLIAILGEVLYDLRKSGRCYVKYEVKQHCFHITVRK